MYRVVKLKFITDIKLVTVTLVSLCKDTVKYDKRDLLACCVPSHCLIPFLDKDTFFDIFL